MTTMNAMERVRAVLAGEPPDRPPVSFWHHFEPGAVRGRPAVDAHLNHLERFDLDFLKIMNDNGYPPAEPVAQASDLRRLDVLSGLEDE
ncbi:MAG: uroporphyrinogen decarboxylase family protein, partial [Planctomycetota bacterium]